MLACRPGPAGLPGRFGRAGSDSLAGILPFPAWIVPEPAMDAPSAVTAPAIRSVSLARSGPVMVVGPSARAARIRARLVMDLEPGSRMLACTAAAAAGAGQATSGWPVACMSQEITGSATV